MARRRRAAAVTISGRLTLKQRKLVEASAEIRAARAEEVDYLHTVQCQCGLPYKNPGEAVREWDRKQGMATLRIEAGSALDPRSGQFVKLGLPYGEKPRLVLIHLATEAVRTGSPQVDVEESMTAFARSLGLQTNGHHLRGLKGQLARLAAATVRLGVMEGNRAMQINTQIVKAFDLWFPADPGQRVMWPSTVRLSDDYFSSLSRHAVPLDRRAVAVLASSSMALDVYVWLAQRLHRVEPGRPQFVPWAGLHEQFGQGFERARDFRRRFLQLLRQVHAAYPTARLECDDKGVSLYHSSPPIPSRAVSVPSVGFSEMPAKEGNAVVPTRRPAGEAEGVSGMVGGPGG